MNYYIASILNVRMFCSEYTEDNGRRTTMLEAIIFCNHRIIWQGRKDCEQNTAICGFEVDLQDFKTIQDEIIYPSDFCTFYPEEMNLGT